MSRNIIGCLWGALALTLFASTASATFIECQTTGTQPGQIAFTGQPITLACGSFAIPAGFTLTGVDLELLNDAQGPGGTGATVTWTWQSITGISQSGQQMNIETAPDSATFGPCSALPGSITTTCPSFLGPYPQNLTGVTFNAVTIQVSATSGGAGLAPAGGDVSARLFIQYDVTPQVVVEAVPEPITLSLVGGGLVGFGLLARKRRNAAGRPPLTSRS
jgi:hypothetical protein